MFLPLRAMIEQHQLPVNLLADLLSAFAQDVEKTRDAEGYADRLEKIVNDESHQLIEEFMLAANESVARLTRTHRLPSLYRVHDEPDPEKLAGAYGFKGRTVESPRELRAALGLTVVMVTHDLDTLFALSTRVAVLADKKVIVTGPPHEVAHFKHPFIEHFFLGERGQRAMAPVQPVEPAAAPTPAKEPR